jgi:DNA-binding NtrC family response regulator
MMQKDLFLVIDDEEIVREAIEDILDSVGIKTLLAANGQQGIEVFKQHQERIQGILLDMKMPGLSGADTLKQLRTIDPAARVILSSGYSEEETRRSIIDESSVSFLPKPYNFDTLINKVREIMVLEHKDDQDMKND